MVVKSRYDKNIGELILFFAMQRQSFGIVHCAEAEI